LNFEEIESFQKSLTFFGIGKVANDRLPSIPWFVVAGLGQGEALLLGLVSKDGALRSSNRRRRPNPAMKTDPWGVTNDSANVTNVTGVPEHEIRTCPACGTKFSATGAAGLCPVCMLRGVAGGESGSTQAPGTATTPEHRVEQKEATRVSRRFENYELMVDERGTPILLSRGAMGITYKAFDVDLRCPVTLKVINERYVSEESARRRFLREARAAASLHNPNVASVFHLGRSGPDYFYAMEFVEGETLESLIKRSGRLDVKLALEITTQVASGLAAVHKQKLVHRDIKPTNIMVRLEE
jgi:hypothetical protein